MSITASVRSVLRVTVLALNQLASMARNFQALRLGGARDRE
jgi:hypothetical protein